MNIAKMITEDMLCSAARIDNLQVAIKDIMSRAGVDDETEASAVLAGDQEQPWPIVGYHARLAMLVHWRALEIIQANNDVYC